jgi:hypothetical protein
VRFPLALSPTAPTETEAEAETEDDRSVPAVALSALADVGWSSGWANPGTELLVQATHSAVEYAKDYAEWT